MPGKTCHDVSGDKNIDWQLADGKGGSSFGSLNKLTTAPTRTLIGRRCKPFAPENKDPRLKTLEGVARPVLWTLKKEDVDFTVSTPDYRSLRSIPQQLSKMASNPGHRFG
jgi:hypothetical protein